MAFLLLLAFLFSKNRKKINWSLVLKGILLQIILALLILKVPFISSIFDFLANAFRTVIDFAHEGATFVFGQGDFMPDTLKNFAFWILPSVIFFSAISSLLYYWGILQLIVKGMAWVMKRVLGISGSESVAAAANIFIGQTEAPLLVKPYLPRMTKSEIMCLMVGGMATIAGGVLAAVIKILGDGDAVKELFYAKHLLTASIMSAPAAIVFAKMLLPETEPIDNNLDVSKEKLGANALEAITNGTTDGMKLAVNVGAMLIVFISLIALFNYMLGKAGEITHLNDLIAQGGIYKTLSFESISGYFFAPIAWMMGVEWQDSILVGQLLGEKTILNEFIAYPHLGLIQDELSQKSIIMCTYVLCGFANFASIGIQVGGIGILVPEKKGILAKYGFLALIGGTLACMSTAVVAGMLF
jgi:CNT family concentrative nucleoside transporter